MYANDYLWQRTSAHYIFPVPANAAVCSFRMELGDGRCIYAIVKESSQAKEEFEAAVHEGKWAGLLEQSTGDGEL